MENHLIKVLLPCQISLFPKHTIYLTTYMSSKRRRSETPCHLLLGKRENIFLAKRRINRVVEKKRRRGRAGEKETGHPPPAVSPRSPNPLYHLSPSFRKVQQSPERQNGWRWIDRHSTRGSRGRRGRESLSSGGRRGQTGVMEARVDIVWHYRTNFLRRTLQYWFRRAELPGRAQFVASLLSPFHPGSVFSSFPSIFHPTKAAIENGGRGAKGWFCGRPESGLSPVATGSRILTSCCGVLVLASLLINRCWLKLFLIRNIGFYTLAQAKMSLNFLLNL